MERVDVSTVGHVCVCLTSLRGFSEFCLLSLRAISVCSVGVRVRVRVHMMVRQYERVSGTIPQTGCGQQSL